MSSGTDGSLLSLDGVSYSYLRRFPALAGVSIDGVATVTENGGCPAVPESGYGGQGQFDLGTLTSTIVVYEYVTFAISPGTASTRRRTL